MRALALALLSVFLLAGRASADPAYSAAFHPSVRVDTISAKRYCADTEIRGGATQQLFNYGAAVSFRVGKGNATQGVVRSLLYCDIATALADSGASGNIITAASLELTVNTAAGFTADSVTLSPITRGAFVEGAGSGSAVHGANWISRDDESGLADLWRVAGASGADSASSMARVGITPRLLYAIGGGAPGATYDVLRFPVAAFKFDSLPSNGDVWKINVLAAVQAWKLGYLANYGAALRSTQEATASNTVTLASSEATPATVCPRWIITSYDPRASLPLLSTSTTAPDDEVVIFQSGPGDVRFADAYFDSVEAAYLAGGYYTKDNNNYGWSPTTRTGFWNGAADPNIYAPTWRVFYAGWVWWNDASLWTATPSGAPRRVLKKAELYLGIKHKPCQQTTTTDPGEEPDTSMVYLVKKALPLEGTGAWNVGDSVGVTWRNITSSLVSATPWFKPRGDSADTRPGYDLATNPYARHDMVAAAQDLQADRSYYPVSALPYSDAATWSGYPTTTKFWIHYDVTDVVNGWHLGYAPNDGLLFYDAHDGAPGRDGAAFQPNSCHMDWVSREDTTATFGAWRWYVKYTFSRVQPTASFGPGGTLTGIGGR